MYGQGRRPSESESISSEISDVTSRATTIPDTWSDVTLPKQQQNINISNIPPKEDDRSSTPLTTTGSVNTVISMKTNTQRANNNQSNQVNTQNQQQQQPWVNPYWGSNWKPGAPTTQSGTNNTNTGHSSSGAHVQQLIPGSIIINDRGEIDDLSWKQNTPLNTSTSNNSFNPGGKYISDDTGGPGGYLVPTHVQRRIVTSSPGVNTHPENQSGYKRSSSSSDADTRNRPEFTRQQTFPEKTDNNIQSWVNPYWPKSNQTNSQFTQKNNTNQNQNPQSNTWENPYWKDKKPQTSTTSKPAGQSWENPYWNDKKPQTSTTSKQEGQPWKNPYWNDKKPQASTTSKQEGQSWENPYWNDKKPQASTTSKQEGQSWENPYWKDKKPQASTTSTSKDQTWKNPYWKDSKLQTSPKSKQENQPWENPYWKDSKSQTSTKSNQQQDKPWKNPYWVDKNTSNQGINGAALNNSLSSEFEIPPFYEHISSPATPSYSSVSTAHTKHETVLSSETPKPITNDNDDLPYTIDSHGIAHYRVVSSSSNGTNKTVNFASTPTTSQYPVLPQNPPSTVPTSQIPNATSTPKTANTTSHSQITSVLPPSFSNLNNYPSSSFDYSSSISSSPNVLTEEDLLNIQHILHLLATNSNAVSVIETPTQISTSHTNHHSNPSSSLPSSVTVNQHQQPPPLSSSFSQNVQFNSSPHTYNSTSEQSTLFSTPSYPSNSKESSHRLLSKGQFVLI